MKTLALNKRLGILLAGSFVLLSASASFAEVEENFKTRTRTDLTKVKQLESELDDAAIANELEEADGVSYEAATKEAKMIEANIKKDIQRLESQVGALKSGTERAKKNAEIQQKRVDLQRQLNQEARKRVLAAQKQKAEADAINAKVLQEFQAAEIEMKAIQEENREIETHIRLAEEDRAKMIDQIKQTRAIASKEKQRKQLLQEKRAHMVNQNRALQKKVVQNP